MLYIYICIYKLITYSVPSPMLHLRKRMKMKWSYPGLMEIHLTRRSANHGPGPGHPAAALLVVSLALLMPVFTDCLWLLHTNSAECSSCSRHPVTGKVENISIWPLTEIICCPPPLAPLFCPPTHMKQSARDATAKTPGKLQSHSFGDQKSRVQVWMAVFSLRPHSPAPSMHLCPSLLFQGPIILGEHQPS